MCRRPSTPHSHTARQTDRQRESEAVVAAAELSLVERAKDVPLEKEKAHDGRSRERSFCP